MVFGMITKIGKVFVSSDTQKNSSFIFTFSLSDLKPNVMMISALQRYDFWKIFLKNFKMGVVYYESQKIKHYVFEVLKLYNSIK